MQCAVDGQHAQCDFDRQETSAHTARVFATSFVPPPTLLSLLLPLISGILSPPVPIFIRSQHSVLTNKQWRKAPRPKRPSSLAASVMTRTRRRCMRLSPRLVRDASVSSASGTSLCARIHYPCAISHVPYLQAPCTSGVLCSAFLFCVLDRPPDA